MKENNRPPDYIPMLDPPPPPPPLPPPGPIAQSGDIGLYKFTLHLVATETSETPLSGTVEVMEVWTKDGLGNSASGADPTVKAYHAKVKLHAITHPAKSLVSDHSIEIELQAPHQPHEGWIGWLWISVKWTDEKQPKQYQDHGYVSLIPIER